MPRVNGRLSLAVIVGLWVAASKAHAANLIVNGSFEQDGNGDGRPDGWSIRREHLDLVRLASNGAAEGKNYVRLALPAKGDAVALQPVSVAEAQAAGPFKIRLHVKLASVDPEQSRTAQARVSFQCKYRDGSSKWEYAHVRPFQVHTSDWTRVEFLWQPEKPIERTNFVLHGVKSLVVCFDDVQCHYAFDLESVSVDESFSNGLPDFLLPHIGEWGVSDGVLATAGDMPECGWYIRTRKQYYLKEFSLKLRKTRPGGIVFIHTRRWRLLLRPRELMLKHIRGWDTPWVLSATRAITFEPSKWYELRWVFAPDFLDLYLNDERIVHWTGPASEWTEESAGSYKGLNRWEPTPGAMDAVDNFVVLHAYQTGMGVDAFALNGIEAGEAQGFRRDLKYQGPFVKDNAFERLAPLSPVSVNWRPPSLPERAAKLPPLEEWRIDPPLGPFSKTLGTRHVNYFVGLDRPTTLPGGLFHPRYNTPSRVSVYFNLKEAGTYSLLLNLVAAKNMPQILEVAADGKIVSREVYRGLNPQGGVDAQGVWEYVPLELAAGSHVIDISLSVELVERIRGKLAWFRFGRCLFRKGLHEPVYRFSTAEPEPRLAAASDPRESELFGKVINLRVDELPNGPATLRLGFYEVILDSPGERLMDVLIDGTLVARDFDVVKEAGRDLKYVTKDFPAHVSSGSLTVSLRGKNFQSFVNSVQVLRDGKAVFSRNLGWSRNANPYAYFPRLGSEEEARARYIHGDPDQREGGKNYFEGHNLAGNPSFTHVDDKGQVVGWRSVVELREDGKGGCFKHESPSYAVDELGGTGAYELDRKVHRTGPHALRIGRTKGAFGLICTMPPVNYTKRYRFSLWAKTENASGRVRLGLYWFAQDMHSHWKGAPVLRLLGRDFSNKTLTGTSNWTQLDVEARPRFGTAIAALAVVVEDNTTGRVWIDDAHFDGYGAEPLEVTYSHLGFHPRGSKRFLIKSLSKAPVSYALLSADTAMRTGQAEYLGLHKFPDRHYYLADLTRFTKAGSYRLRVSQSGQEVVTDTVAIGDDAYLHLSGTLMHGINAKRFNVDVPGYHGPTHLEDYSTQVKVRNRFDRQVKLLPGGMNTLGGFYDAGDKIKHWEYVSCMVFGPLSSVRLMPHHAQLAGQGRALALWGLDNIVRVQAPDGSFCVNNGHSHYDSIPYYGAERFFKITGAGLPQHVGLLAWAAYALRDSDPTRSRRYQQAATVGYRFIKTSWEELGQERGDLPFHKLMIAPKLLFADTYLHTLTGEAEYRQDLERRIVDLCEALDARAYLAPGYRHYNEHAGIGLYWLTAVNLDFAWMPVFFLEERPQHPLAARLKRGLLTFAEDVKRLSAIEPWGQAMDLERAGKSPARWPCDRPLGYWSMLAYSLARLGALLGDRDLVLLGEQQLQWNLGHNPYDVCMVQGIGTRFVAGGDFLFNEPEFYNAFRKSGQKLWHFPGNCPTMAFRASRPGIRISRSPWWGPISGLPSGFPPEYLAADYPFHPAPTEFHQPLAGNFCAAAVALAHAFESMDE